MTKLIAHYYKSNETEQKKLCKEYLAFIEYLPCCFTGSISTSKPHHVRIAGYCGMGMKPPDIFCIPVSYPVHTDIHQGKITKQSQVTRLQEIHSAFWKRFEI